MRTEKMSVRHMFKTDLKITDLKQKLRCVIFIFTYTSQTRIKSDFLKFYVLQKSKQNRWTPSILAGKMNFR